MPVKPTPISCAYAGTCRALAISWAYTGVLRCLAVPDEGRLRCRAEAPLMGGGGCFRRAGLERVFINRPIKKYPPHSPIPNQLPVLLKECC